MSAMDARTHIGSRTRAGLWRRFTPASVATVGVMLSVLFLLIRVRLFALFRGISEIVVAFEVRRAQRP